MAEAGDQIDRVQEVVPGEVYLYFDEEGLLARLLLIGVEDIYFEEMAPGLVNDLALAATTHQEEPDAVGR